MNIATDTRVREAPHQALLRYSVVSKYDDRHRLDERGSACRWGATS